MASRRLCGLVVVVERVEHRMARQEWEDWQVRLWMRRSVPVWRMGRDRQKEESRSDRRVCITLAVSVRGLVYDQRGAGRRWRWRWR
jgi:hypothetical protein